MSWFMAEEVVALVADVIGGDFILQGRFLRGFGDGPLL